MKTRYRTSALAVLLAATATLATAGNKDAAAIAGRWDAALVGEGPEVAFRLDISGSGNTLKGTFYDGPRAYESTTAASFEDGKLVLKAEHYLTTITAQLQDGKLVGDTSLQGPGYSYKFAFKAKRHVETPVTAKNVPTIAGDWVIPLDKPSSKGEKAFRFIVEQKGSEAYASILRVDGDTGTYSGAYKDGKWVLSHFDGHRPGVIQIATRADGTLAVTDYNELLRALRDGEAKSGYVEERYGDATPQYTAYRTEVALAKGLPQPADFLAHTTARDPNEKFAFSFPDLNGKLRSQDDPYFKGEVIVAIVTGTWCPNCHDEAQYLVELDKQYRDKGLRIVALNFEEPEQQGSLERVHAFVKQYGVKYPYLQAGAPAEMWEKVPQLVNLNTWPATVFVGRDGKVRAVHAGFASLASGKFHEELRRDFTTRIEALLAEPRPVDTRVSQFGPFRGP
jgi:thiol-disulfide isomerase/thioredoxin